MATADLTALAIHAAVVTAVKDSTFPLIRYVNDGSAAQRMEALDESESASPRSITVHEVQSTYRPAARNRRTMTFERDLWMWQLFLDFDTEVSLESFINKFLEGGLVIPADPERGSLQVVVTMQSSPFKHPPRSGGSNGTSAVFTLIAAVHPK